MASDTLWDDLDGPLPDEPLGPMTLPPPEEPILPEVAVKPPAATAVSQKLAPGGGGGGCWLGGPKTASSAKFGHEDAAPKDFALFGHNLFGDDIQPVPGGKLAERFTLPPFSVLDARQGVWQDRKRAWLSLGIQSELGRAAVTYQIGDKETWNNAQAAKVSPGGIPRPACDDSQRQRGDGAGRPLAEPEEAVADEPLSIRSNTLSSSNAMLYAGGFEGKATGTSGTSGTSIFDPVLCELFYRWFCPPAGLILDPFAGGSVRGVVASKLGFSYLGIELRTEQLRANAEQADRLCAGDALPPRWVEGDAKDAQTICDGQRADFVFSCPPYADLEQYSDDPRDLSKMEWPEFCAAYKAIIAAALAVLKPDRFACFVVGDLRDKKGLYRCFPEFTAAAFIAAGAAKYNEAILVTAVGSLPIRIGKQFDAGRKLGKTHQNVLVFVKGDPKRAAEACNGQLDLPAV